MLRQSGIGQTAYTNSAIATPRVSFHLRQPRNNNRRYTTTINTCDALSRITRFTKPLGDFKQDFLLLNHPHPSRL